MARNGGTTGILIAGVWALVSAAQPVPAEGPRPARKTPLAERLGCTHVSGTYSFTRNDFLNEGADEILKLGMRVIKLYLSNPAHHYRFNSEWPKEFASLVAMARHPYYRALFRKPFKTYIMTVYALGRKDSHYWRGGVSDADFAREEQEFHDLAKHFLETYRGTGKTFVFQHWEGDWALRGSTSTAPAKDPSDEAARGMARWLNARQDGVSRARREVRSDVKVYHACEVNLAKLAMDGRPGVINNVLPQTHCDLYSYSAYDTIGVAAGDIDAGRRLFRKALDCIAARAPDSAAFGAKNVYVGEFGWPEVRSATDPDATTEKSLRVLRMTVEESLDWGCPYVVYWQVYDNESRAGGRRPANDEVRGFYLIKPDGTRAAAWDYFASLLRQR